MRLAPILEHFKNVKGLNFNGDICPTKQQLMMFQFQLRIAIVHMLLKYCPKFHSYADDPALQNLPCCPIPLGYVTEQFLL